MQRVCILGWHGPAALEPSHLPLPESGDCSSWALPWLWVGCTDPPQKLFCKCLKISHPLGCSLVGIQDFQSKSYWYHVANLPTATEETEAHGASVVGNTAALGVI